MPEQNRSARETLRLAEAAGDSAAPPWSIFDPEWYRACYPDAPLVLAEELLEWHLTEGQVRGHSPNRYFAEEWQRRAWPGIQALIETRAFPSAFDAWCRGAHASRAPHWLFDPREYRVRYPALTDEVLAETGFLNPYHHYLQCGAAELRVGHVLFDPAIYLAALDDAEAVSAAASPFEHYLRALETGAAERRTSWLFDPDWYRERYPVAAQSVESREFRSALEHYLGNGQPSDFDPSPWFSEPYYLGQSAGLAEAIGPDGFRNGFEHFVRHGIPEGRSPHPDLDLAWYGNREDVRADIEAGRAHDAFAHWIAIGQPKGLPGRARMAIQVTEAQAIALYQQRAHIVWPLYGRQKLDFSHQGAPALSVIMAVREHFAETMVSLASLRAQYHHDIDLILVDSRPPSLGADLETHVAGATVLRFGTALTDAAAREAGLICAIADAVLFLGDGVDLAPGAIAFALSRLNGDAAIGAVGGRLVQPHGRLLEAGGIIGRHGELRAYAHDASPLSGQANFTRDVDFCSAVFLLGRRDVLTSLGDQADGLAGTTHDAADLCARISEAGFRVAYDPNVLVILTHRASDRLPDGTAAFVAAHGGWLAERPVFDLAAALHARSPRQARTRVLYIEDSIPLRRIGSGFVRSNDVLRALIASDAFVTVFPMRQNLLPLSMIRAEIPDQVEVMDDLTEADFAGFLEARRDYYDLIWIARTHNLDQLHPVLTGIGSIVSHATGTAAEASEPPIDILALLGRGFEQSESGVGGSPREVAAGEVTAGEVAAGEVTAGDLAAGDAASSDDPAAWTVAPRIIVDTEAVASIRLARQAAMHNEDFDVDAALRQEFRHLDPAMHVVAVSEAEAEIIRVHHQGKVSVLGHAIAPAPTPRSFAQRTGILFVGAIHGKDHPNMDGLAWFIDEVLPIVERTLRWETRLTVAGYTAPAVSLDRFKGHSRVTLRGPVADLTPLYDSNRVFIAPIRFAAGIPFKVHEAAAFGIPVVATSLMASQVGWADGEAIGAAEPSDPEGFARRVIALHRDAALWSRIREGALARIAAELDPARFAATVADIARPVGGEPSALSD